jgi:hypothetical protein
MAAPGGGKELVMYIGFAPAVAAVAPATGPLAPIVMGASLASSLITSLGSLFGAAPRGELQKFQRTLYPYMRTVAAQNGVPAICLWFGEAVQVRPDGSYAAIASNLYLSDFNARLDSFGPPFYVVRCYRSDGDCVNHPGDAAFELYDPYGAAAGLPVAPVGAPSGSYAPSTGGGVILPGSGVMRASVAPTGLLEGKLPLILLGAGVIALLAAKKR